MAKKNKRWIQKTKIKEGAFKEWAKRRGLLNKDGTVGRKAIEAGLKSKNPTIRKRAQLAKTFAKLRRKKKKK